MVTIRNAEAYLTDLSNFLRAFTEGSDLSENAVLRDLSFYPVSVAGELISTELQKAVSLQLLDSLTGTDLDNEGTFNFGLPRKVGVKARGVVTFAARTEPSADIVIPRGTIVKTLRTVASAAVRFVTIESKTLYYATRSSFFDPASNTWLLDVQVEAVLEGANSNVGPNSINTMQTRVSGIDLVYNQDATYNGADSETDSQYRNRLKKFVRGRGLGYGKA